MSFGVSNASDRHAVADRLNPHRALAARLIEIG